MAPRGLAIIIGTGLDGGLSLSRILSNPNMGNLAVALLSRNQQTLNAIRSTILKQNPGSIIETFHTNHDSTSFKNSFKYIRKHPSFESLPLALSTFSISCNNPTPFNDAAFQSYRESLPAHIRTPIYIYERNSIPTANPKDHWQLIGSFVSPRRAAIFLGVSTSEIQRYGMSGAIYKDRYKLAYK